MSGETGKVEQRWVCSRHEPAVLLAKRTPNGALHIKVGAREWRVFGFECAIAICPKCGAQHLIHNDDELQRARNDILEEHTWQSKLP